MADQTFPKGLRIWAPRENAPTFIKGKLSIHLETFMEWAQKYVDEKGYIAFDLKESRDPKDGIYAVLNTWKNDAPRQVKPIETQDITSDEIPF